MAATGDTVRQAVDLDNLIQEYMHFEKVSLNIEKEKIVSFLLLLWMCFRQGTPRLGFCHSFESGLPAPFRYVFFFLISNSSF